MNEQSTTDKFLFSNISMDCNACFKYFSAHSTSCVVMTPFMDI